MSAFDQQALVDTLPATGILVRGIDGTLEYANAAARHWWPGVEHFRGDRWENAVAWMAKYFAHHELAYKLLTVDAVRTEAVEVQGLASGIGPRVMLAYRQRTADAQVAWVFHDASRLGQTLHQLRAQQARFRAIMEQSPIAIRGYNQHGKIIHWNQAAESLYGYKASEMLGQTVVQHGQASEGAGVVTGGLPGENFDEALSETVQERADGQKVIVSTSRIHVQDLPDGPEVFCIDVDVTQRAKRERKAKEMAFRDALTGLPNRASMEKTLERWSSGTQGIQSFCLCFMDLNGFKAVNDTHGHAVGDQLLMVVSKRLQRSLREIDRLFRLGGDEFVILLPNTDETLAGSIIDRCHAAFHVPLQIDKVQLKVALSVGMAVWPIDAREVNDVIHIADERMYEQKRERKARQAAVGIKDARAQESILPPESYKPGPAATLRSTAGAGPAMAVADAKAPDSKGAEAKSESPLQRAAQLIGMKF